ncbi:MAG: radical SAM protein [Zoogloeaceae bacterium]|jgi:radical SAM superfamily enzyme YgiQ (UPF0313 family)|nr:radical SAM protein [Zoogloeaceae bacterium]
MGFPLRYIEPVYRPPSEARSLILPLTDGCSWNRCAFCEMYTAPQKRFRARDASEVLAGIQALGKAAGAADIRRIFLADGDALVLPTRRLLEVLFAIRAHLPAVHRVSCYGLPRNVQKKSVAELRELAAAGLSLVYVGAESGDDAVLARINKGETFASTLEGLEKLGAAGIRRSVMILNGLGGEVLSDAHARHSAELMNAAQPEYLATLVLSFPLGEARFRAAFPEWTPLSIPGLLGELARFIERLELKRSVFRSDHASNWLSLRGNLPEDKEKLLNQLQSALARPETAPLRPAWARGL